MEESVHTLSFDEARQVLGVSASATDAELRAAYLEQVKLNPPDRQPDAFERIRDAYNLLNNPEARAHQILAAPSANMPLKTLLSDRKPPRRFTGPEAWLQALRENRS